MTDILTAEICFEMFNRLFHRTDKKNWWGHGKAEFEKCRATIRHLVL